MGDSNLKLLIVAAGIITACALIGVALELIL